MQVEWVIIGNGALREELHQQWKAAKNVTFASPKEKSALVDMLKSCDVFVLPTAFEGFPVSIIEAMSCGLVPVVTDLPGGIAEIINDQTGFKVKNAEPAVFADHIARLDKDRIVLNKMRIATYEFVKLHHNIKSTADAYFKVFTDSTKKPGKKVARNVSIGSSLDRKHLPNWFVKFIRTKIRG